MKNFIKNIIQNQNNYRVLVLLGQAAPEVAAQICEGHEVIHASYSEVALMLQSGTDLFGRVCMLSCLPSRCEGLLRETVLDPNAPHMIYAGLKMPDIDDAMRRRCLIIEV